MNEREKAELLKALWFIDPISCDYKTWLEIGMALKAEGFEVTVWDEWSQKDPDRYKAAEIHSKWKSFKREGITGGTIFHLAKAAGYKPDQPYSIPGKGAGYPEKSSNKDLYITEEMKQRLRKELQPERQETTVFREPGDEWSPENDALKFLTAMFGKDDELKSINWRTAVNYDKQKQKYVPSDKGSCRSASNLIYMLRNNYTFVQTFGPFNANAGIWVQCNLLDGNGVGSGNIYYFRHAVIECDALPIEEQIRLMHELQLPITAMVFSGNRSVHAAVKIEAGNQKTFTSRLRFVRSVCKAYGLEVDDSCSGYMMRLPGAMRSGHKQFLIETNSGKRSYLEWEKMIKEIMHCNQKAAEKPEDYWSSLEKSAPAETFPKAIDHADPGSQGLTVITMDQIQEKELKWIWFPRIPKGKITLIQGAPGVGKSMFVSQLIADLTSGSPFIGERDTVGFDGKPRAAMNVLYQIVEDDASDTVKPRLIKAGADLSKVFMIDETKKPLTFMDPRIKEAIIQHKISVAIFDPLVSYMGSKPDMNKANEARAVMQPLVNIAQETGCTFLIVAHTNKQSLEKSAMNRLSGSVDFLASVRSMLTLGKDPSDSEIKALALTKSNLAKEASTILFKVTMEEAAEKLISFVGYSDLTSDEIIQRVQKKKSSPQLEEAKGFLATMLSTNGYYRQSDLEKERKRNGISKSTMYRAKDEMRIVSVRRVTQSGEQCWFWKYIDRELPDVL